jgi:hypothetical protein
MHEFLYSPNYKALLIFRTTRELMEEVANPHTRGVTSGTAVSISCGGNSIRKTDLLIAGL